MIPERFHLFKDGISFSIHGTIDLNDVLLTFNSANSFTTGYVVTDINGDNTIDLNDVLIAFNNANNFVNAVRP